MMPSTLKLKKQERNWLEIPTDVTTNILKRIGAVDILKNVQIVCTTWHKICKDPAMWRVINMNDFIMNSDSKLSTANFICKHAVDRSQGQLVDLTLVDCRAELFLYAADRSSQLRRLEVASSIYFGSLSTDALMKLPLLEELNLYAVDVSKEEIETLGRYCPLLKTFKLNEKSACCIGCCLWMKNTNEESLNTIAIAIGQNLVELRHLELIGNKMTNNGLQVILDNCHHLETLDLRRCYIIDIQGDLGEKCSRQIKHLKLPSDSLEGCPYFNQTNTESSDEDED